MLCLALAASGWDIARSRAAAATAFSTGRVTGPASWLIGSRINTRGSFCHPQPMADRALGCLLM